MESVVDDLREELAKLKAELSEMKSDLMWEKKDTEFDEYFERGILKSFWIQSEEIRKLKQEKIPDAQALKVSISHDASDIVEIF